MVHIVTKNKMVLSGKNAEELLEFFNETGDMVNDQEWASDLILFHLTLSK
jgi:hypothetical protein